MPIVTDSDGVTYFLVPQQLDSSCAAASVAMVVGIITRKTMADDSAPRDKLVGLDAWRRTPGLDDWNSTGAFGGNIGTALSEFGVKNAKSWWVQKENGNPWIDINKYLQQHCKKEKPGIGMVIWNGGGGHAVVVLGPDRTKQNLLILDPEVNNQVVSIPLATLPSYNAPYGSTGSFIGVVTTD